LYAKNDASSAIELLRRACDADFFRRARIADVLGRTWDVLRAAGAGGGDKILDLCLVVFVALCSSDLKVLEDLCCADGFYVVMGNMLQQSTEEGSGGDIFLFIEGSMKPEISKKLGLGRREHKLVKSFSKNLLMCLLIASYFLAGGT